MGQIRVLLVEPGKAPRIVEVENELRAMQDLVGGFIEAVPMNIPGVVLVCNGEGKIRGDDPNRFADLGGRIGCVYGTFFICGSEGEEFASLSPGEEHAYMDMFGRGRASQEAAKATGGL